MRRSRHSPKGRITPRCSGLATLAAELDIVRPPLNMRAHICVALLLVLLSGRALACSCRPQIGPAQAFSEAAAVRLVAVTRVRDRQCFGKRLLYRLFRSDYSNYEEYSSRFGFEINGTVQATFKGPAASRVRLLTGRGGGDCGLGVQEGAQYVFYLSSALADGVVVTICDRVVPEDAASQDLLFLQGHR